MNREWRRSLITRKRNRYGVMLNWKVAKSHEPQLSNFELQ